MHLVTCLGTRLCGEASNKWNTHSTYKWDRSCS